MTTLETLRNEVKLTQDNIIGGAYDQNATQLDNALDYLSTCNLRIAELEKEVYLKSLGRLLDTGELTWDEYVKMVSK